MRTVKKQKHVGTHSKKAQRKVRADARQKAWDTLTPEGKKEISERNKAEYDAQHKS